MQRQDQGGSSPEQSRSPQRGRPIPQDRPLLPDANPIQQRQKLRPHSIFRLQQLPRFKYSGEAPEPTSTSENVTLVPERLELQSTELREIFARPTYVYHSRCSLKNNSEFGCMRVLYSESDCSTPLAHVETIKQYKRQASREQNNGPQAFQQDEETCQQYVEGRAQEDKIQQLFFSSRFQSGNLCCAAPCANDTNTYYLACSRDMNTSKCTQWFFFKTINRVPGKVTFHILNLIKDYSVFQNGMKICNASKSTEYRWARGCSDIKYRRTNIPISPKNKDKFYYALSFSYHYTAAEDVVYFAYCYPYTYSMLEEFLFCRAQLSPFLKRRAIATTPGGNNVDLITITNFRRKEGRKRTVFVTSRVHPGETPSSFVCEAMMKYLLGDSQEASALRDCFVFKFVPMLNPDGVINGSYRCNLSGYDLNRVWHRPDKTAHPQIYGTRKVIQDLNQTEKIFLFADLHAHSKKKGIFAYGCQNRSNPYLCRQIPFLLWKRVPDFNYYQCNFVMRTGREGTSRLYLYRDLGIDYSYTIEHSFCGPSRQKMHFTCKDYERIGVDYLLMLYTYFCRNRKLQLDEAELFHELLSDRELLKVGDAEELSSSDQQLDKEKAPVETSPEKKLITRRQSLKLNPRTNEAQKEPLSNHRRTGTRFYEYSSRQLLRGSKKQQSLQAQAMKPLPIVTQSFSDKKQKSKIEEDLSSTVLFFKSRACFNYEQASVNSSMGGLSPERKAPVRQNFRYEQQQDVNELNNLFLPSLTSGFYRKYSRKNCSPRNIPQLGNNLLETAITMKEEIRSVFKRKGVARSCL